MLRFPCGEWSSFVFLHAAACGAYEWSTCSCRRLINYVSTPFPAGESNEICSLILNTYLTMKKAIKIIIITLLSLIAVITITVAVLFALYADDIISADEPNFVTLTPVTEEFDSIALVSNMEMPDSIRRNLEDYDYLVSFVEMNYAPFSAIMEKGYEQEYRAMRKQLRQQVIDGEADIDKAAGDYIFWFYSRFDRHINIETDAFIKAANTIFPMSWEIIEYAPKAVSCKVDSCTWLIRVPSCDLSFMEWTNDAFQQFVDSGCKNLIIDIRGNLGGVNVIWNSYYTALYDHPSKKPIITWLRNTPENMNAWERSVDPVHPNIEWIQNFINECKLSNKEFVKLSVWTGDTGLQTTTRINRAAVITDWHTASAAESLVGFVKKHSERAKVYGICNTNGCELTGDCVWGALPNSKIKFQYPTTVISGFYDNDFSGTPGIAPDIIIPLPYATTLTDNIDEWVLWVAEDLKR